MMSLFTVIKSSRSGLKAKDQNKKIILLTSLPIYHLPEMFMHHSKSMKNLMLDDHNIILIFQAGIFNFKKTFIKCLKKSFMLSKKNVLKSLQMQKISFHSIESFPKKTLVGTSLSLPTLLLHFWLGFGSRINLNSNPIDFSIRYLTSNEIILDITLGFVSLAS